MSKKSHSKKFVPKNEFRYNSAKGHKQYVFGQAGDKYKSLGLTHEQKTFGRKNMPLVKNPQKGKTERAYIRNGIVSDKTKYYGKPLSNYEFDPADKANVKSKIRNYKKSRKKNKKKSKQRG